MFQKVPDCDEKPSEGNLHDGYFNVETQAIVNDTGTFERDNSIGAGFSQECVKAGTLPEFIDCDDPETVISAPAGLTLFEDHLEI